MVYWRLFYHAIWATHNREPLIHPDLETDIWRVLVGKATQLGAHVYAVGGVEDHVHVVASVPPRIALSEFIQQLKGNSSHFVNHHLKVSLAFSWQAEYGVVSFDDKHLDRVVKYVRNQKQHHSSGETISVLERTIDADQSQQATHPDREHLA